MDWPTVLVIAVGLSMDAFAVSVVCGAPFEGRTVGLAVKLGLFFGGFQALMPVLGWLAGSSLREHIAPYDHWIAMGLLGMVGGKMLWESLRKSPAERALDTGNLYLVLVLAVATSIDALAVGLALSVLNVDLLGPVLMIGAVTFMASFVGVFVGRRLGVHLEHKAELIGGIILLAIGVRIVVEHVVTGT